MVIPFAIPDLAILGKFAIVITAVIKFFFIYLFIYFRCGYICTASENEIGKKLINQNNKHLAFI